MVPRQLRWMLTATSRLHRILVPVRTVRCRAFNGDIRQYKLEITDHNEFDRLYAEIFLRDEYDWSPESAVDTPRIIDLGGHIGMSVVRWKSVCPTADATVVEPNPSTVEILRRNIARNHLQGIKVIHADGYILSILNHVS
jgi:hypothetical protein